MTWESAGLVFGGIGLFLLGISLMTEGFRVAAGESLSRALRRMTGSPFRGIGTGALLTALLQSSSATTLMTVGLVSAGVISFSSSVGVIFGANVGTTMMPWLVTLIGLKFKISLFAFPLVGLGAAAMVLGRGSWKHLGQIMAGFALLFIGIDYLQLGMKDVSGLMNPDALNPESLWERLILVLMGVLMVVVMQSSGAAVASTLTALDSGAVTIGAAAALVIGQNIGSALTSAIGGIGAPVPAKRTVLAHVLFNVLTGVVAFAIFPLFERVVFDLSDALGGTAATTKIAAFHTAFSVLGLLILVPFIERFSSWVERLVPEKEKQFSARLSEATLTVPSVALDAVQMTFAEMLREGAQEALVNLNADRPSAERLMALSDEKKDADRYLMRIGTDALSSGSQAHHVNMMHAADHLDRFLSAVSEEVFWRRAKRFAGKHDITAELLETLTDVVSFEDPKELAVQLEQHSRQIAAIRAKTRAEMLRSVSLGRAMDSEELDESLRYVLSVDRCGYHLWRAALYLAEDSIPEGEEPA